MRKFYNEQLASELNQRAVEELSAVHQYTTYAQICGNWGYNVLQHEFQEYALQELHHAQELMERILYIGGQLETNRLEPFQIPSNATGLLMEFDAAEADAIENYNRTIQLSEQVGDYGTAELIRHILSEEEGHKLWVQRQLDQLEHVGLDNYLTLKVDNEEEDEEED
ncbi:MAG: ferritin [Armatimonadota bacterium]|nr:MAG: ferritin [Armatimonadota bacterium]